MAEPVSQVELNAWLSRGIEMLGGLDGEIDLLLGRVRELRALRGRLGKVFGRAKRGGRPPKGGA